MVVTLRIRGEINVWKSKKIFEKLVKSCEISFCLIFRSYSGKNEVMYWEAGWLSGLYAGLVCSAFWKWEVRAYLIRLGFWLVFTCSWSLLFMHEFKSYHHQTNDPLVLIRPLCIRLNLIVHFSLALERTMYNFKNTFSPNFVFIHTAKYVCTRNVLCHRY